MYSNGYIKTHQQQRRMWTSWMNIVNCNWRLWIGLQVTGVWLCYMCETCWPHFEMWIERDGKTIEALKLLVTNGKRCLNVMRDKIAIYDHISVWNTHLSTCLREYHISRYLLWAGFLSDRMENAHNVSNIDFDCLTFFRIIPHVIHLKLVWLPGLLLPSAENGRPFNLNKLLFSCVQLINVVSTSL